MRAGAESVGRDSIKRDLKKGDSRCSGKGAVYSRAKSLRGHELEVTSVNTVARIDRADSLGLQAYR